eukprot:2209840-Prymnesium_polylepis.1
MSSGQRSGLRRRWGSWIQVRVSSVGYQPDSAADTRQLAKPEARNPIPGFGFRASDFANRDWFPPSS